MDWPRGSRAILVSPRSWRCHFARGAQHGAHHAVLRAATTQIAVERRAYIGLGRPRIPFQQGRRAYQNPAHAIAALHGLLSYEGALQRVRVLGASQSLERGNLLVRDRPKRCVAGSHHTITDKNVAGAALACTATKMRSCQAEPSPQEIEQRAVGIGVNLGCDAIEIKSNA